MLAPITIITPITKIEIAHPNDLQQAQDPIVEEQAKPDMVHTIQTKLVLVPQIKLFYTMITNILLSKISCKTKQYKIKIQ